MGRLSNEEKAQRRAAQEAQRLQREKEELEKFQASFPLEFLKFQCRYNACPGFAHVLEVEQTGETFKVRYRFRHVSPENYYLSEGEFNTSEYRAVSEFECMVSEFATHEQEVAEGKVRGMEIEAAKAKLTQREKELLGLI